MKTQSCAVRLFWHRKPIARNWDCSGRRSRTGRPPTAAALRKLVPRLAGNWISRQR
jgi:hypothetical protein